MWIVFAFGAAVFAGVTAILAKVGIADVDSTLATAVRTVVVMVFAALMVLIVGSANTLGAVSGRTFLFLGLSGLATGASWLAYFRAIQLGNVNQVAPVDKLSVVLTILIALLFLHESSTGYTIAGIVLIGAGTLLMSWVRGLGTAKSEDFRWLWYAVLAAVFAALTAILAKVGIEDIESNLGTAVRTLVVLVMAWGMVYVTGKGRGWRNISRKSWTFLCLSGIATGASWLCFYRALQLGPASVVVPVDKLSIAFTVAFSYFFLGEKLTPRTLSGLVLIIGGTMLLLA